MGNYNQITVIEALSNLELPDDDFASAKFALLSIVQDQKAKPAKVIAALKKVLDALDLYPLYGEDNADRIKQLRHELSGIISTAQHFEIIKQLAKEALNAEDGFPPDSEGHYLLMSFLNYANNNFASLQDAAALHALLNNITPKVENDKKTQLEGALYRAIKEGSNEQPERARNESEEFTLSQQSYTELQSLAQFLNQQLDALKRLYNNTPGSQGRELSTNIQQHHVSIVSDVINGKFSPRNVNYIENSNVKFFIPSYLQAWPFAQTYVPYHKIHAWTDPNAKTPLPWDLLKVLYETRVLHDNCEKFFDKTNGEILQSLFTVSGGNNAINPDCGLGYFVTEPNRANDTVITDTTTANVPNIDTLQQTFRFELTFLEDKISAINACLANQGKISLKKAERLASSLGFLAWRLQNFSPILGSATEATKAISQNMSQSIVDFFKTQESMLKQEEKQLIPFRHHYVTQNLLPNSDNSFQANNTGTATIEDLEVLFVRKRELRMIHGLFPELKILLNISSDEECSSYKEFFKLFKSKPYHTKFQIRLINTLTKFYNKQNISKVSYESFLKELERLCKQFPDHDTQKFMKKAWQLYSKLNYPPQKGKWYRNPLTAFTSWAAYKWFNFTFFNKKKTQTREPETNNIYYLLSKFKEETNKNKLYGLTEKILTELNNLEKKQIDQSGQTFFNGKTFFKRLVREQLTKLDDATLSGVYEIAKNYSPNETLSEIKIVLVNKFIKGISTAVDELSLSKFLTNFESSYMVFKDPSLAQKIRQAIEPFTQNPICKSYYHRCLSAYFTNNRRHHSIHNSLIISSPNSHLAGKSTERDDTDSLPPPRAFLSRSVHGASAF